MREIIVTYCTFFIFLCEISVISFYCSKIYYYLFWAQFVIYSVYRVLCSPSVLISQYFFQFYWKHYCTSISQIIAYYQFHVWNKGTYFVSNRLLYYFTYLIRIFDVNLYVIYKWQKKWFSVVRKDMKCASSRYLAKWCFPLGNTLRSDNITLQLLHIKVLGVLFRSTVSVKLCRLTKSSVVIAFMRYLCVK